MNTIVISKYAVLTNKPLTKDFSAAIYQISFKLPSWFTDWNKIKIIKVYGCSFNYLESENKIPILGNKYQNQFISVHSNIAHDETTLKSTYSDNGVHENLYSGVDESSMIADC
jgi:hypothetical protein